MPLLQFYGGFRSLVQDVETTSHVRNLESRRNQLYEKNDREGFPKWVVFIAGIGFLTDAFDLFAVNAVVLMLQSLYPCELYNEWAQTALLCATLVGTILGQLTFGYLADRLGRRNVYGLELLVLLISTVGTAMCSQGAGPSMSIKGWLIFWRIAMGVGIGGDYPISAIITSEFAPKQHRARMLAWVFFCQSMGQLIAAVVALISIKISEPYLSGPGCPNPLSVLCGQPPVQCAGALDRNWRWIIAFGAIPAVIAIIFRVTVPETPRWTYEVELSEPRMQEVDDFFDVDEDSEHWNGEAAPSHPAHHSSNSVEMNPVGTAYVNGGRQSYVPRQQFDVAPGAQSRPAEQLGIDQWQAGPANQRLQSVDRVELHRLPVVQSNFFAYIRADGNWRLLLGTAGSWFLVDCCFYGLGLHTTTMVDLMYKANPDDDMYHSLMDHVTHGLLLSVLGAVLGSLALIKLVKRVATRTIQLWGGACLAALLFALGGVMWSQPASGNIPAAIFLFVLCEAAFNVGPNATTFMIPAELFATKWRGTCYGISAASGKLGSIIVQLVITASQNGQVAKEDQPIYNGPAFIAFGCLMVLGVFVTYLFVPNTRDVDGKSMTLEQLQHGHHRFEEIRKAKQKKEH